MGGQVELAHHPQSQSGPPFALRHGGRARARGPQHTGSRSVARQPRPRDHPSSPGTTPGGPGSARATPAAPAAAPTAPSAPCRRPTWPPARAPRSRRFFDNGWALTELLFAGLDQRGGLLPPAVPQPAPPAGVLLHAPRGALREQAARRRPRRGAAQPLLRAALRDRRRRDELGRPLQERHGVAQRRRVPRLPPRGATRSSAGSSPNHPGLADGHAPIGPGSPLWALFLGFEHERIHLETSSAC